MKKGTVVAVNKIQTTIIQLKVDGYPDKLIADHVRYHWSQLMEKLGVRTPLQDCAIAVNKGWATAPPPTTETTTYKHSAKRQGTTMANRKKFDETTRQQIGQRALDGEYISKLMREFDCCRETVCSYAFAVMKTHTNFKMADFLSILENAKGNLKALRAMWIKLNAMDAEQ